MTSKKNKITIATFAALFLLFGAFTAVPAYAGHHDAKSSDCTSKIEKSDCKSKTKCKSKKKPCKSKSKPMKSHEDNSRYND